MIILREAVYEDVATLLAIYNDIILNTTAVWQEEIHSLKMRQDWFNEKQVKEHPIFVAEENRQVIGFSTYGVFRASFGYRFTVENSVYVSNSCRGKGVASLLMAPLINAAKNAGVHVIVAGIEAGNIASIALHKKFGFTEAAHFKQVGYKFGKWLDLKFLQLLLTEQERDINRHLLIEQ